MLDLGLDSCTIPTLILRVGSAVVKASTQPDMLSLVVPLLQDICRLRSGVLGPQHPEVAAAQTATGLALAELGETQRAVQQLQMAKAVLQQAAGPKQQLQIVEQAEARVSGGRGR